MALRKTFLSEWLFALGETENCLTSGHKVTVPHTWSIEEDGQNIVGKGWYRTVLASDAWQSGERVFLRFRGAYRDTSVFVNGKLAAQHNGCGYTPFEVEITCFLRNDRDNRIAVSVDNSYSRMALPYDRSFDWANDGGLYRPVELLITGPARIRNLQITAKPVILPGGKRQNRGEAAFGLRIQTDGADPGATVCWELYRGAEDSITPQEEKPIASGAVSCGKESVLPPSLFSGIAFWHFDRPELYTLRLRLELPDGSESDIREWAFGFRELKVQGFQWFLNGEPVRLPGTEWMPGSDPGFGMAESLENLEKMLRILKESNSVLTRFHWQQDDWVYDWCDRHGMLVQEEIPFWGQLPPGDPDTLWPVFCQQITEMIEAHCHHPSIIAWGVGNELAADTWPLQRYIRRAAAFTRELDDSRLVNYVSNSAFACPRQDGTGDGDILMVNDYIGTWLKDYEQFGAWENLLDARPGRAFVPSEFGLCEPAFSGGDERRERIFMEKLSFYRAVPQIAGTVYFCLNDYRTHIGEEGDGRLKRRVHGSAGLCGDPKPSYFSVRREYAPLSAERTENGLKLSCKQDLPSYSVEGYLLKNGERTVDIPTLAPGESWLFEGPVSAFVSILRPTGDFVMDL